MIRAGSAAAWFFALFAIAAAVDAAFSYPAGLIAPANPDIARQKGIYPAAKGETCCFLAKTATLELDKPRGATTATFTFYVPDLSPFAKATERIAMTFDGIAIRPVDAPKGLHDVIVALPPSLVGKTRINAYLAMSIAFVPVRIGLNSDQRTLSIVLTRVRYR